MLSSYGCYLNYVKGKNSEMFKTIIIFAILSINVFVNGTEHPVNPVTQDVPPKLQSTLPNELGMLDTLISATEQTLDNQKNLRALLGEFLTLQKTYLDTNDDRFLRQMVIIAHRALENIKENHLTYAFDAKFLGELSLFSQVATKRNIPKAVD